MSTSFPRMPWRRHALATAVCFALAGAASAQTSNATVRGTITASNESRLHVELNGLILDPLELVLVSLNPLRRQDFRSLVDKSSGLRCWDQLCGARPRLCADYTDAHRSYFVRGRAHTGTMVS